MTAAKRLRQRRTELWEGIGIAARYGNQPLSEVLAMTPDSLRYFHRALIWIIERESK